MTTVTLKHMTAVSDRGYTICNTVATYVYIGLRIKWTIM